MHLIALTMTGLAPPSSRLGEQEVGDLLRAHTQDGDGVEHVLVRAGPNCFHVGMLVLGSTYEQAELKAHSLCQRTIRRSPALAGVQLLAMRPRRPLGGLDFRSTSWD